MFVPTAQPVFPAASGQPTLAGSPVLANTTMETFHQVSTGKAAPGCFSCHETGSNIANSAINSTLISHVFNLQNQ